MRARWRRTLLPAALFLLAAASTGSCANATEVVVVVDGDLGPVDTISVRVEGAGSFVRDRTVDGGVDLALPLTLGVHASGQEPRSFLVRATARRGDRTVVARAARATLAAGESRVLVLALCRVCEGVTCGAEETCGASGRCEAVKQDELPPWRGTTPRHGCARTNVEDPDGGTGDPVVIDGYHAIEDRRHWSSVDLAEFDPGLRGYVGAAFDSAFLYLAPATSGGAAHGRVARYDTRMPLGDVKAWTSFDVSKVNPGAKGFAGAASFRNEYVYLVPHEPGAAGDVVARYKVGAQFDAAASWDFIALGPHETTQGAGGFGGAAINLSHVWLPSRHPERPFALHENRLSGNPERRIDVGWSAIDVRGVAPASPGGYFGGTFDGLDPGALYFAPARGAAGPQGVALKKVIGSGEASGWVAFDLATKCAGCRGYAGAVLARGFVYLVPHENERGPHGNVARIGIARPFDAEASWEVTDLSSLGAPLRGFLGGVFDGRYVYLVPSTAGERIFVVRHDTRRAIDDADAWSRFDVRTVGARSAFAGGAFDGQYVYFVPAGDGPLVRFKARETPDPTVKTANGSFL
jgi:hypothetical protein